MTTGMYHHNSRFAATVSLSNASPHWGIRDWTMAVTVVSYVFAIVDVPLFPVSPQVIMPFVLLLVCASSINSALARLIRQPAFWLIVILWGVYVTVPLAIQGPNYDRISEAGRTFAAAVLLVAIVAYIDISVQHFCRVQGVVLTALIVSATWFILEIFIGFPFADIRAQIYDGIYSVDAGIQAGRSAVSMRTGLTPFPHDLGYQLSATVPLLFARDFMRSKVKFGMMSIITWGIVLLALFFSSQRSAVIAILVSFLPIIIYPNRYRRRVRYLVFVLSVIGGLLVTVTFLVGGVNTTGSLQLSVIAKLVSPDAWADAFFRLSLQVRAVQLLLQNPFGLQAAGLDWNTAGFWYVYDQYPMNWVGALNSPVAAHNHYLTMSINLGVLFLFLAIAWLILVFRLAWRLAIWGVGQNSAGIGWLIYGPASVAIGLYSFQAMTHNNGIISLERQSVLILPLLFSSVFLLRNIAKKHFRSR